MSRTPAPIRNGLVTFGLMTLALGGAAARLVQIEMRDGEKLRVRAQSQQTAVMTIPAQRGSILDTKGRELAGTLRRPSVFVDASLVSDPHYAACTIAPILGLDAVALERELVSNQQKRFLWVKREITDAEADALAKLRETRGLRAFVIRQEPKRQYLSGSLAAHVLGFVGADQVGLAGVEQAFDEYLGGRDGRRSWIVDEKRSFIEERVEEFVPPQDGCSVVLTIDAFVQSRTEHHLRAAVEQFKAEWGTAVVLDPQSGEVLAMATYPSFSPENAIPAGLEGAALEAARDRLHNRAVAGAYEPGSMFKPFIVACALEDGLTRWGEIYAINGPTRQFGSRTIHDTHAYASLTLEEVISKSSNIGMGMLGLRCGNARLNEYVRRFGFGDPTGVTLPGEHDGLVQDFARWGSFSTTSIPIGQEIAITPLQLAAAFSVFCNGGLLHRPRIVRGILGPDGRVVEDLSHPIATRRVISEQTARDVRLKSLVEVVNSGTGKQAAIVDYQVFGKTGTAQIANPNGRGYLPGKYMGSFIGGAPSDYPRAVAVVSLFKPSGGKYYGGTVSAPAVADILADTLKYMQVPPERTNQPKPPVLSRVGDD